MCDSVVFSVFFFFNQKTAYEMRISDWSSDVCSSDLPFNGIVPESAVPALPFVFRSTQHMRTAMDGKIGDDILAAFEPHGFIGLCFYDSGARSFYNRVRPIHTPADMKGMKIRVIQSDIFVALVQSLGANATPMPFGEVYTALKTGEIGRAHV